MSFAACLLRCADGSNCASHADELNRQPGQHPAGGSGGYTAPRRPVESAWSQAFTIREEAPDAEQQIKGWLRATKNFVKEAGE